MTSHYYYRKTESVYGLVTFRDVVKLVRDGKLGADDLVKADWESEWHAAAEVVGLFHMAGRDDVLAVWEEEQREKERLRLAEAGRSGEIGADELDDKFAAETAYGSASCRHGRNDVEFRRRTTAA